MDWSRNPFRGHKIIHIIFYDLGERVTGPVHPSKTGAYNREILPFDFDPEKAKHLLSEAGWNDSNGDGTLDKVMDGKTEELILEFAYNAGNDERKGVGLIFQEEARKAGIRINVVARERSVYSNDLRNHRFEIYYGAW